MDNNWIQLIRYQKSINNDSGLSLDGFNSKYYKCNKNGYKNANLPIHQPSGNPKEGVRNGNGGFKGNCNSCAKCLKKPNTSSLKNKIQVKGLIIGNKRTPNTQTNTDTNIEFLMMEK